MQAKNNATEIVVIPESIIPISIVDILYGFKIQQKKCDATFIKTKIDIHNCLGETWLILYLKHYAMRSQNEFSRKQKKKLKLKIMGHSHGHTHTKFEKGKSFQKNFQFLPAHN